MLQQIYCIASPVREQGELHQVLTNLRSRLNESDISFEPPKMGDHITFIPPFRATAAEIKWLAAGLTFSRVFHNKKLPKCASCDNQIHFFRNVKNDALVLKLMVDNPLQDIVEQWRSKLSETNDWVYLPESYLFTAHTTVGEGENLFEIIKEKKVLESFLSGVKKIVIPLDYPLIWEKMPNKKWRPVHF